MKTRELERELKTLRRILCETFPEDIVQDVLLKFWQWRERITGEPLHWCRHVAKMRGMELGRNGRSDALHASRIVCETTYRGRLAGRRSPGELGAARNEPHHAPTQETWVLLREALESHARHVRPVRSTHPGTIRCARSRCAAKVRRDLDV